jgi:hypothetical protein
MNTLQIGVSDVYDLTGGRTTLGARSWNKLASLVASRMNRAMTTGRAFTVTLVPRPASPIPSVSAAGA